MKFKKTLCSLVALSLLTTVALTGCNDNGGGSSSGSESASASETGWKSDIEITAWGVMDPQISAQQIVADKMGYFAEEGLNVTCEYTQSGTEMAAIASTDEVQISFETNSTDLTLRNNGVDTKILATLCNIGGTQAVVAREGMEINSPQDLEGKTIGMAAGSGVDLAIRNMCEATGVDYNALNFVNLQPSDQVAAMTSGEIDLMACWEPWVTVGRGEGGTVLFTGIHSNLPGYEGDVDWLNFLTVIRAREGFIDEYPEECEALLRALMKATDYINENTEEAAQLVAEELNIDPDDTVIMLQENVYDVCLDEKLVNSADLMGNYKLSQGQIEAIPELSSYVEPKFLREIDSSKVSADFE